MGRPVDPNAQFRVKPHVINGYTYASTQPHFVDPNTGKKRYRYVHWGTLDESMSFIPGLSYIIASPEERAKLIFPDNWDISATERIPDLGRIDKSAQTDECLNQLYGDVWLLEQVAKITGIRNDLELVFHGNKEIVDDILTLAIFPYLTKYSYSRVARWQRNVRTPSTRSLSPADITRLTQSITEQHRMDLLRLRAMRLKKDELCAADSTSRSAYGEGLADIRWGRNKEQIALAQTLEVVVYTLSGHMPVYYRTFPGNMPDSRSLETIMDDLDHAGFRDIVLITDRGYETLGNLEKLILRGQAMIMCSKVGRKDISEVIEEMGEFSDRPQNMTLDPDARIYYMQIDGLYTCDQDSDEHRASERLKLNIYFDSIRRSQELLDVDISTSYQSAVLAELLRSGDAVPDGIDIRKEYKYHRVTLKEDTRFIQSYELDEQKLTKVRKLSGFFAIVSHRLDFSAMEVFHTYRLRDEQEKYFQQMKDQLGADRQRNWSEEGKTGRLFILFVSMILSSYVRHIWKSTSLKSKFSSSLDMLDEMRSIRMIEYPDRSRKITPFVGAQLDICEAFGFDIPEGSAPANRPASESKRKRGRPRKVRS